MHSISTRNFEIHIFALLTSRRKFQNVTGPKHKETKIRSLRTGPYFTETPLERIGTLQGSPRGGLALRRPEFWRPRRLSWSGERSGVTTSAQRVGSWLELARKHHRRAVTAEAGGRCRWNGDFGELSLRECEPTAWGASMCPRGGARRWDVAWSWRKKELGCDAPGFQPEHLTLIIQSTVLTLVKRRSTWAITSKTSPTNPNDPFWSTLVNPGSNPTQNPLNTPLPSSASQNFCRVLQISAKHFKNLLM
jgi:hypothetical protein